MNQIQNIWTEVQDNFLQQHYKTATWPFLIDNLNRTRISIQARALKLGLRREESWSQEQIEILQQNYLTIGSLHTLSKTLNKSVQSIKSKAASLNLIRGYSIGYKKENRVVRNDDWKDQEINDLKLMYAESSVEELETYFQRKIGAIRRQAGVLKLKRKLEITKQKAKKSERNWTKEEDDLLIQLYIGLEFKSDLFKRFQEHFSNRTESAIISRLEVKKIYDLRETNLKGEDQWSEEQDILLKEYYGKISDENLQKLLGRDTSIKAIQSRASYLGINKLQIWTIVEVDFLQQNFATASWNELNETLNRDIRQIRQKASRLNLNRNPKNFWREGMWTNDELDYLKNNYREAPMEEILINLKRTYHRIQTKAHELELTRINKGLFSENLMRLILDEILIDEYCEDNKRYDWLRSSKDSPLQLDRFYPERLLAFEYNGKNHYDFDAFVGVCRKNKNEVATEETLHQLKDKFDHYIKNDQIKREICKKRNITLITLRYDDPLSVEHIKEKIKQAQITI